MFDPFPFDPNFTRTDSNDGFLVEWTSDHVYVNPPFSHGALRLAIKKCLVEYLRGKSIALLTLTKALEASPLYNIIKDMGYIESLGYMAFKDYSSPLNQPCSLVILINHEKIPVNRPAYTSPAEEKLIQQQNEGSQVSSSPDQEDDAKPL